MNLFDQGRWADAKTAFERLWAAQSDSAIAAYYLGRIEDEAGAFPEATEWFQKAIELEPSRAEYHLWLGHGWGKQAEEASVFRQMGLAKKCRSAYEKAVQLDPSHLEARESLFDYYLQAPGIVGGGADRAMSQAQEVLAIHAPTGHRLVGSVHSDQGDDQEALTSFRAAIEADALDPATHHALGIHHQSLERWNDAYEAFEASLRATPGYPNTLYQIGRTGALSGVQLTRAQKCLEQYLELESVGDSPGKAAAHWRLGMVHEQQGTLTAAIEHFEASIRLDPENKPARNSLKAAKRKRG